MIPKQFDVATRSFLAAAVICGSLVPSAAARADEASPGGSDEVVGAVGGTGAADAPVPPRISRMSHQWIGYRQEEFRLEIRFSQDVTGFDFDDIRVFGATPRRASFAPTTGPARYYFVTMDTWPNHDNDVIVTINGNVAENDEKEGNNGHVYMFDADTRAPRVRTAEVDGGEVTVTFSEDLDESTVPPTDNFSVLVSGEDGRDDERISRVRVEASEVILTLAGAVRAGDDVELYYDSDAGARALRDEVGNLAPDIDALSVVNKTSEEEAPGRPLNLRATASGTTAIDLEWEEPADDGSSSIIGYSIEVSRDGGTTWSHQVRNTRSTRTTYTHTGLTAGTTRHYRVSAINSYDTGAPSSVARATTEEERVPDAPSRLTARATGTATIELSWTAPSSGSTPITGYRIEWSRTGSSRWTVLEGDTDSRATEYSDIDLSPGTTRYYRVAAINRAGRGPWSDIARASTEVTTPDAPTGLKAVPSAARGSTRLLLTWTRPSTDGGSAVTGYRIEMSPTGVTGWALVAITTGTATTYQHTGLIPGTTRYYRVAAINGEGRSDWSSVVEGTTDAAPPGQPQNLRARGAGPSSVTLTWDAPTSDGGASITGYRVRALGPSDGTWITIQANTGSTATTFTHTGLQPATAYRYQVAAINRVGTGAWSFEAGTNTHPDVPGAPFNLTAREVGTSRIDLSWSPPRNTGGAPILGYRVEASDDAGGTWRIIRRNTGSAVTTFADLNLRPASTRHYRVAAINTAGTGPLSNIASATTEATLPGAPRTLVAEADGTSRIDLSWRAPTSDGGAAVTGYRIEASDDGGVIWQDLMANTRTTTTTHSHTGLEPATTRHYRVSAVNRIGAGQASRVASATTDATVPDAPTSLTATATTPTRIDLAWTAPAYDGGAPITGYRIEVSETGAAWTGLVRNTKSTATTFSHTGLKPGSVRHYRVSAINRAGTGAASASASAATDDPVQRAGRLNTRVLPHVAAAMTSSTVSAIARRVDAVANGMGMERSVEANGLSSMAASLSAPGASPLGLGQRDGAGLAALFGGTSFTMPLGNTTPGDADTPTRFGVGTPRQPGDTPDAPQQSATGTQMATWGAGEYHHLGEPGASALDWNGNMVSAHMGVDARIGSDLLAGVAGSYNSGSFDFTDKTGARPVAGTYGATMTSAHPYLAWFPGTRGTSVWGSAGIGRGDIEVNDEREGLRTSPASTLTGAAGGSYQLLTSGIGGVRLKAEGWTGRFKVEGAERIEAVTLEMQRAKLALELTQGFRTDTGHEVAFVLEGGMRYDDGDGVNGASGEVGGGLRYTNSRVGMIAEGRGRFVLSARDGYEEWGFGGMLQFDPAVRGQGLSIRVAPSWGDAASGVNQLWERGVSDAVRGHGPDGTANIDGEISYGIASLSGTPYGGFHLGERGLRAFSSGVRYDLGAGVGVRLEGTRRESALRDAAHTVGIRGRIKLR